MHLKKRIALLKNCGIPLVVMVLLLHIHLVSTIADTVQMDGAKMAKINSFHFAGESNDNQ